VYKRQGDKGVGECGVYAGVEEMSIFGGRGGRAGILIDVRGVPVGGEVPQKLGRTSSSSQFEGPVADSGEAAMGFSIYS
jgi:hypothetical protein